MFIAKEKLKEEQFKALPFGKTVRVQKYPGEEFVVTRLGLATIEELKPVNLNEMWGKYGHQRGRHG